MKIRIFLLLFLSGLYPGFPVAAIEQESTVKAAFLLKFCDYVSWPEDTFSKADSPIIVGVAGNKYQIAEITALTINRYIGGRPFVVREIKPGDGLHDVHVLYVTRDAKSEVSDIVTNDTSSPVLTVTDEEKKSPLSIINFIILNNHVRFEISMARAEELHIKLSSQLLAVAHKVHAR